MLGTRADPAVETASQHVIDPTAALAEEASFL
jgi:hypothetical protein